MRVHHSSKRISVNVWGCPICGARNIASTGRGFLLMGVGASDVATCFGLVGSVSMGSAIVACGGPEARGLGCEAARRLLAVALGREGAALYLEAVRSSKAVRELLGPEKSALLSREVCG